MVNAIIVQVLVVGIDRLAWSALAKGSPGRFVQDVSKLISPLRGFGIDTPVGV